MAGPTPTGSSLSEDEAGDIPFPAGDLSETATRPDVPARFPYGGGLQAFPGNDRNFQPSGLEWSSDAYGFAPGNPAEGFQRLDNYIDLRGAGQQYGFVPSQYSTWFPYTQNTTSWGYPLSENAGEAYRCVPEASGTGPQNLLQTSHACIADTCSHGTGPYSENSSLEVVSTSEVPKTSRARAKQEGKFRCTITGCPSKDPNFGSKKDLERHHKGVHHINGDGSPITLYNCPREGCPRNRQGFTRRENLAEHLKRLHKGELPSDSQDNRQEPARVEERTATASSEVTAARPLPSDPNVSVDNESNQLLSPPPAETYEGQERRALFKLVEGCQDFRQAKTRQLAKIDSLLEVCRGLCSSLKTRTLGYDDNFGILDQLLRERKDTKISQYVQDRVSVHEQNHGKRADRLGEATSELESLVRIRTKVLKEISDSDEQEKGFQDQINRMQAGRDLGADLSFTSATLGLSTER